MGLEPTNGGTTNHCLNHLATIAKTIIHSNPSCSKSTTLLSLSSESVLRWIVSLRLLQTYASLIGLRHQESAVLEIQLFCRYLGCGLGVAAIATGCASIPNSQSLEQGLRADPQLANNSGLFGSRSAQLPSDFPSPIPRYPGATLLSVEAQSAEQGVMTQWESNEASDRVIRFFQEAFAANNWSVTTRPDDDRQGTFLATLNNLTVTVTITPAVAEPSPTSASATPLASPSVNPNPTPATQFSLQYRRTGVAAAASPATNSSLNPTTSSSLHPGSSPIDLASSTFQDLQQAPQPLQPYLVSLAKLGVFTPLTQTFQPNAVTTRREFIRWLVTAQNKVYANRPALQIRLTTTSTTPVFKDLPQRDPDFGAIQGAAETGLIPSPLSGNATTTMFNPNAPLTRETLLLWKVPLDMRRSLPTASVDSVKEVWGFQDAARINPMALKAVLADHQNGELSNISRAFGYTTLFQPQRSVTRAEAAASLWYFGFQGDGFSADDVLQAQNMSEPSVSKASKGATPTPSSAILSPTPASSPNLPSP